MDITYSGNSSNVTNIFFVTASTTTFNINPILSDNLFWYFRLVFHGILGQILAIVGCVTNAINIIVFLKLGVRKDPMNVSLLGLSVSDFFSCFFVTFLNLCFTPGFTENEDLPFTPVGAHHLFSSWPHAICVKITILITAFIAIERCLCVTYPLKIKQLITTKRVAIIIISCYISMIALTSPIYHMFRMKWVFFPSRNRSVYILFYHEDQAKIEPALYTIFSLIVPTTAYIATIISTIILVHSLKKTAEWRSSVTNKTTNPATSNKQTTSENTTNNNSSSTKNTQGVSRDAKVAKMVVVISTLYIACYLPVTPIMFAAITVPEIRNGGVSENILYTMFSPIYILEATNASLNLFIYYRMSSNYKTMFQSIFYNSKKV